MMRACILIIWLVTSYDVYCNTLSGEMLFYAEAAPITRGLLNWLWSTFYSDWVAAPLGPIAILSAIKIVMTFIVTEILRTIPERIKWPVVIGVTAGQMVVLMALTFPRLLWL